MNDNLASGGKLCFSLRFRLTPALHVYWFISMSPEQEIARLANQHEVTMAVLFLSH
jgi:hypothetical protein